MTPSPAVSPPSATMAAPVTADDSSLARKSATLAISSGWRQRPRACSAASCGARLGRELPEEVEERRLDRAGADAVGANALAAVLDGNRARQVHHRGFGGRVRRRHDLAEEPLDRRRRDDGAAAARKHRRDGRPHAVEDSGERDLEAAVPDLRIDVGDVAPARPDGVVVHHVEPAEALDREGHRRLQIRQHADVRALEGRPAATRLELGDEARAALLVHVGAHDGGALRREPAQRRRADAGRAAGHDRHLALEPCHRASHTSTASGESPA